MKRPHLTFFCELDAKEIKELFSDELITQKLKAMDASLSLGILDFSSERVDVVRRLNKAGVPVIAWLLLPKEQGYWLNLDNAPQAATYYGRFKAWSAKHKLQWHGIGLDIEPDIRVMQQFIKDRSSGVEQILKKLFIPGHSQKAEYDYRALVTLMRGDGFFVESYQMPFIVDERKAGSRVLHNGVGLIDLPVDREVLMLYSSLDRTNGLGALLNYARDARAVALGSTGGGVKIEGVSETQPLYWQELKRDMLLAYQYVDWIYIFSLEGCVRQGFLDVIADFDWDQPVSLPIDEGEKVGGFRQLAQALLWITARPWWVWLTLFGSLWIITRRRKNK
jgi:hypothetical protein